MPIADCRLNGTRKARGFSFTEILFAVMILGIGFIMVAAMFPVAIHQTEDSTRDTSGAAIARTGAEYMEKIATQTWPLPILPAPAIPPPTTSALAVTFGSSYQQPTNPTMSSLQAYVNIPGQVWTFNDSRTPATSKDNAAALAGLSAWLWSTISGNLIIPDDTRYAWVGMYKRDMIAPVTWSLSGVPTIGTPVAAPYAQLIMIAVQSRSKPTYDSVLDIQHPPTVATLEPDRLPATLARSVSGLSTIKFTLSTTTVTGNTNRVGEGAYVVVSDDTFGASDSRHGAFNGRIYRVGVNRPDLDASGATWSLIPGDDLSDSDVVAMGGTIAAGGSFTATVLMVGRGYDPSWMIAPFTPPPAFSGAVQDVAAYTTFVQISN